MRLLHTRELTFQEFFDECRPAYAILSHRWTDQEVSYKQYLEKSYTEGPGISKIRNACAEARLHNLDWLWADTICIDKSSSAELTEAINSMWNWYKVAAVCLVILADVKYDGTTDKVLDDVSKSEWFLRGWTLQELLGPRRLLFFDDEWEPIGLKSWDFDDMNIRRRTAHGNVLLLTDRISRATGIETDCLTCEKDLMEASVAMKMSWAAKRMTTRIEDQAYCLMGIFGVNMPLLYGEGKDAFFRLQLEILRTSDDESIFAWRANDGLRGLLADSPRDFATARNIHKMELGPGQRVPWAWTNEGLELRLLDQAADDNHDPMPAGNPVQTVHLGCYIEGPSPNPNHIKSPSLQAIEANGGPYDSCIAISIKRFCNAWYRIRCGEFYLDSCFQLIPWSTNTPLVYKYYYVPRYPSRAALDAFDRVVRAESGPKVNYLPVEMRRDE